MCKYNASIIAAKRFLSCKKYSRGNTRVVVSNLCCNLYLFDNLIASNKNGTILINFRGFRTRTTVDRLEAVTGLTFSIAKDKLRYKTIGSDWIEICSTNWYKLCRNGEKVWLDLLE